MTTVPHAPEAGNRTAIFAPNWLGDAVMALPAIADVRRAAPATRLIVVARPSVAPLFTMVAGIDEILVIDARDRLWADPSVARLKGGAFDSALLLPNSFYSAQLVWRAGIPNRWGYRAQGRTTFLTRSVATPNPGHQTAFYQHLVRGLGFENGPAEPELTASSALRVTAADLLAARGWDRRSPLVAFAPGAANGRAKQWPPSSFAAVTSALVQEGATPVIVGSTGDAGAAADLLAALDPEPRRLTIDLVGGTDLPTLAGVLVHCRALVTNDSGGMHLAAALSVPVIALFGPSNEEHTRPRGRGRSVVLTSPVWCRPCLLKECPIDHRCLRGIAPQRVLNTLEECNQQSAITSQQ